MNLLTLASSLHVGGLCGSSLLGRGGGLGDSALSGDSLGGSSLVSVLDLLEGGLARSSANLGLLVSLPLDDIEGSTDDGSLDLLDLAGLLLGDLLSSTLAVQSTVDLSPSDRSGVHLAVESGLALAVNKSESFAVTTDES